MRSVTAEPASGSVMPTQMTPSPASRRFRKRSFCVAVPYSASTRIGPKLPACTTSALRGQTEATVSIAITASISAAALAAVGLRRCVMPSRPCFAISRATSQG